MLVWVPGPGHGEQTAEPGSDEYPAWQALMTEREHLLPWGQTVHVSSDSLAMYLPFSHKPWQFPSLSWRVSDGHLQSYTDEVPVETVEEIIARCS